MKYIALFLVLITAASCGPNLRPFTQNLYDQYQWSDNELERIQFYLSDDVVLTRQLTGGSSEIISGEIKIIDGRKVEQVVIRRGTPGVLLFKPKQNRFAIGFESNADERYLIFGPNPKAGDRYSLLASDWNRRDGTVTYDGRKWSVNSGSAFSSLMVDLKKINKVENSSRTAGGRRVNGK